MKPERIEVIIRVLSQGYLFDTGYQAIYYRTKEDLVDGLMKWLGIPELKTT